MTLRSLSAIVVSFWFDLMCVTNLFNVMLNGVTYLVDVLSRLFCEGRFFEFGLSMKLFCRAV